MPKHKIAKPGTTLILEPNDKWVCACGQEHKLGAYVAAHWDIALNHTCPECGVKRTFQSGKLRTPRK